MGWVRLRGMIGKSMVGLAAVGLWASPLQAQQPLPRLDLGAMAEEGAGPQSAEKDVTLAADGSFRAAVVTRSGNFVAAARLTFKPRQSNLGPAVNAVTSPAGITVITGTRAGLYDVHVEAPQGVYDGTLRVMTLAGPQQAQSLLPPLVTFVLTPAAVEESDDVPAPADPGRRRLLGLAAAAGTATAIALPLSLRPARRASP